MCDTKSDSIDSITAKILSKVKDNLQEADISSTLDASIIDQLKEFGINPLYLDMPSVYDIKGNGQKYEYKIVEVRPNRIIYKSKKADAEGGFGDSTYQMDFKQFAQVLGKTDISGKRINAIKLKNALHKFNEEEFTKKLIEERDRRIDIYLNYIKPDDHYGTHADFSIYKTVNPKLYNFLLEKQSANTANAKEFKPSLIKNNIINHKVDSGEFSTDQRDFITFELLNYENSSIDGSLEELIRSDTTGELYNNLLLGKDVSKSKKSREFHEKLRQERNAAKILSQIGNIPPEATDNAIVATLGAIPVLGPLVGGLLLLSKQFGYSPTYYVNAIRRAVTELSPKQQREFTEILTEFHNQLPVVMNNIDINKAQIDTLNSYKQLGDNIPVTLRKIDKHLLDFANEQSPEKAEQLYKNLVHEIFEKYNLNSYLEIAKNYSDQMENFIQERNALIKEKDKLYDKIVDYLQELPDTKTKFTLASLKSKIAFFKEKIEGLTFAASKQAEEINNTKNHFMEDDLKNFDNAVAKVRETIDSIISRKLSQGNNMNNKNKTIESLSRTFINNLLVEYYGNNEKELETNVDSMLDFRLRKFKGAQLLLRVDRINPDVMYAISSNYTPSELAKIKKHKEYLQSNVNTIEDCLSHLEIFNNFVKYKNSSLMDDVDVIKPIIRKLSILNCFNDFERKIISQFEGVLRNTTSNNKILNSSDVLRKSLDIKNYDKDNNSDIGILVNTLKNKYSRTEDTDIRIRVDNFKTVFDALIFFLEMKIKNLENNIKQLSKIKSQLQIISAPIPNNVLDIPDNFLIYEKTLEDYVKEIAQINGQDPTWYLITNGYILVPIIDIYKSLDKDGEVISYNADKSNTTTNKHENTEIKLDKQNNDIIESIINDIFTNVLLEKDNKVDLNAKYGFKNKKITNTSNLLSFVQTKTGRDLFAEYLISNPDEYYEIVDNLEDKVYDYNYEYKNDVIKIHDLSKNNINDFVLDYTNPKIFIFGYYGYSAVNEQGVQHIEQLKKISCAGLDAKYIKNTLNPLEYNSTINTYSKNSVVNLLNNDINSIFFTHKNNAELEFKDLDGKWMVINVGEKIDDKSFVKIGRDFVVDDVELEKYAEKDMLKSLKSTYESKLEKLEKEKEIIQPLLDSLKNKSIETVDDVLNIIPSDVGFSLNHLTDIESYKRMISIYKDTLDNLIEKNKNNKEELNKLRNQLDDKLINNAKTHISNIIRTLESRLQSGLKSELNEVNEQLDMIKDSRTYIDYLKRVIINYKNIYDKPTDNLLDKSLHRRDLLDAEHAYSKYVRELIDKYIDSDDELSRYKDDSAGAFNNTDGHYGEAATYEYVPYSLITRDIMKNLDKDYQKFRFYLVTPVENLKNTIEADENKDVLMDLAKNYKGDDLRSIKSLKNQLINKNERDLKVLKTIKDFMREYDNNFYKYKLQSVESIEELTPMEFINIRKHYYQLKNKLLDGSRESLPAYNNARTPIKELPSSADTHVTNEFMKMLRSKEKGGLVEDFVNWVNLTKDKTQHTLPELMYEYLSTHQNSEFVNKMKDKLGGFPEFEDLDLDSINNINTRLKRLRIQDLNAPSKDSKDVKKVIKNGIKGPKTFTFN